MTDYPPLPPHLRMPTKPGELGREADWQSFVQQVKPLPAHKRSNRVAPNPTHSTGKPAGKTSPAETLASHGHVAPAVGLGSMASHPKPAHPKPTNRLRDIDRRNWLRLKRGEWPIDATIDLHGCTLESAHQQLVQRLCDAWQVHQRCLLVITGVGRRSPSGIGAIKQALPFWIQESPLVDKVLAYCPAQPHHGGAGALYLLLRRQRLPSVGADD
ncbi:MAG: hypothetical protein FJX22_00485 [Alphaproteobacteria bacterium]|nr:hypothetical protein [Alphaproteobacteria bacterium]